MKLPQRFLVKVNKHGPRAKHAVTGKPIGRCWMWLGSTVRGYGRLQIGSRTDGTRRKVLAHRFAYEMLLGPIRQPQLDHLCRRPACVNPAHLEPVTNAINVRRGQAGKYLKSRTHCPAGHPYDEKNTRHVAGNRRQCRVCCRAATRRWYARKVK